MELDKRKIEILNAIINNYFETALPVGSRTLSKQYDLGISPATIRNEMSDLEELGFIIQPHTSSGRIPSDKGYRLYVDMMLQIQKAEFTKLVYLEELKQQTGRIEDLLKNIAKRLADETSYATVVSAPKYESKKIKNVQLIEVDQYHFLTVIIAEGSYIKDRMIAVEKPVDQVALNRISLRINQEIRGLHLEELNLEVIRKIKGWQPEEQEVASKVIDAIFCFADTMKKADVYTYGATNILQLPDFQDISKATSIIKLFEEKDLLQDIINTTIESEDGKVKIVIGEENDVEGLRDCSMVTTSYHLNGEKAGAIAIIGPKRMDYHKTVSNLRCLIKNVDDLLNKL